MTKIFEGKFKTTVNEFKNTAQNLGRIATALQEGVMEIRMVTNKQINISNHPNKYH